MKSRWPVVGYYCEVLGLMLWVGGLCVLIAVVIPAVFNSFGQEPAGRFLRRVFDGYSLMTVGIVGLLIVSLGLRFWATRGQAVDDQVSSGLVSIRRSEVVLVGLMVIVTTLIVGVLGPKAVALQEHAFEAVSQADKQQAYEAFFDVHKFVRLFHLINVGLAAGLMISKLRRGLLCSL